MVGIIPRQPLPESQAVGGTSTPLRILLVGGGILPYRNAGDKNFWLDAIEELRDRGHQVKVLSVTQETVLEPPTYPCEFLRPVPVHLGGGSRFNREHQWLRDTNNYPSKTLSFARILRVLRRRLRDDPPDVVHFASNFGPVMAMLHPLTDGVPLSISAPTYNGGPALYDPALRASFSGFDKVVPFSAAFARRLGTIGLPSRRIQTIRWGVNTDRFRPPTDSERREARETLGVEEGKNVVFWSGFLQQMSHRDLEFSVRTAVLMLRRAPGRWRFFFCFKPEHYEASFHRFEQPGLTVGGTAELFHRVRRAADVMISPLTDLGSTAAPPLTWIESMALGIPVVTTPVPGAEEAVISGANGWLARTPEEAAHRVEEFFRSPSALAAARIDARARVQARFALSSSVTEYVDLWSAMVQPAGVP